MAGDGLVDFVAIKMEHASELLCLILVNIFFDNHSFKLIVLYFYITILLCQIFNDFLTVVLLELAPDRFDLGEVNGLNASTNKVAGVVS